MRIQRVGVLSLGQMFGAIMATVALAVGSVVAAVAVVALVVSLFSGSGNGLGQQEMLLTAAIMVVGGPIIYGIMGFIAGAVSAVAFNFVARRTGGLEIDLTP